MAWRRVNRVSVLALVPRSQVAYPIASVFRLIWAAAGWRLLLHQLFDFGGGFVEGDELAVVVEEDRFQVVGFEGDAGDLIGADGVAAER